MATTLYMINHLMLKNSLSTNYSLYYLTKRLNDRVYSKNLLADDNDLLQLLVSQPHFSEIYVVEDVSSGGVYVPSFDLPQSSAYGGESNAIFEGGDGLEAIQRYAYLDLSAGDSPAQEIVEPSITWDEEYVPSSEVETDTSASEDLSEPENLRRAGIEYAGWQNLQINDDDDEQGKEYSVTKSDNRRIYFKCKHSDKCPFKLSASSQDGSIWGVYKFTNEHLCDGDLGRAIQLELQCEFGVHIKHDVALRARNRAIEMVYGRHDQSFEMLPKYLYMLRQSNPGSLVEWEVDPDGRFKHLFVALVASASCFMFNLRPVIVVDGTHLKGKNRGILFVAVTKDDNESLFPLAYDVGPKENDESWMYFMSRI
ncbi:uncharacterized protein LOC130994499 [Salvia miltiorrhiza]|uniref:uncharacterized protein LOC130994432 n=1 Tax=Salvia miltiorrhiza TaxID=226208 RepID=UPI0025AD74AE|nr:uncharacterized protein LOC130994432 [Salvia miltiorrhiza]XP_057775546.1 uncharacterized protein LOC130994499 [Salvia miltiorrhiza]